MTSDHFNITLSVVTDTNEDLAAAVDLLDALASQPAPTFTVTTVPGYSPGARRAAQRAIDRAPRGVIGCSTRGCSSTAPRASTRRS